MPRKPKKATMAYISALAHYKMRVNPRAAFKAWMDDEKTMERVLRQYMNTALRALARPDSDPTASWSSGEMPSSPSIEKPALDEVGDTSTGITAATEKSSSSGTMELPTPETGSKKRKVDDVDAECAAQNAKPPSPVKRKRARRGAVDSSVPLRRSTRKRVAPRRFGASE